MATPPRLALAGITLSIGGTPLLDGASLAVGPGDRICLVGRNGSGKSTMLAIAAGTVAPDGGTRFVQPDTTIATLAQEPDLAGHDTVLAYVRAGSPPGTDPHGGRVLLEALGLAPDRAPDTLSGGEARKAALARVLAAEPDILLLDEPTNHLDLPTIEWLEAALAQFRGGIVLISHDRRLLERVGRQVVWLDNGQTRRLDGPFGGFEDWRDAILAEAETASHKLRRQIAREEDWLRYGVTARRKRNVRRVAELAALRAQRRDERARVDTAAITSADAGMSGRLVAVARGARFAWPGRPPTVRDLDLRVLRGDRLGVVGPNGAGKSTLLGLLTGLLVPDEGSVELGSALAVATLDQQRRQLDPAMTLADVLTGGSGDTVLVNGEKRHVTGVLKDFLFRPEQARTPVGRLSGGERGRLALAAALLRPANLLVLDEPTNDLDLETLDLLVELVGGFAGTVVVVSHDRDFLDRVATGTVLAAGDGRWIEYAGGWSDMLAQRGGRSPFAPDAPPPSSAARADARSRTTQAPAPGAGRARPARLSFKDNHLLETLPARIETLGAQVERLRQTLADPGLYRRDPARFRDATAALQSSADALAAAEDQWLELAIRGDAATEAREDAGA